VCLYARNEWYMASSCLNGIYSRFYLGFLFSQLKVNQWIYDVYSNSLLALKVRRFCQLDPELKTYN